MARPCTGPRLQFRPLAAERWTDFERLFGPRGACAGCWCMWWKLKRAEWEKRRGAANKRAIRALVRAGSVPGILGYAGREPVAWCAVEPRDRYPVLQRSPILKPVDEEEEVWSVTCFFIERAHRGQGVTVRLLEAAAEHARRNGGRILEGYPMEPRRGRMPDFSAFTGVPAAFERAGFVECARRSERRPIMRRKLRR